MAPTPSDPLDRATLGESVRRFRIRQGLTQAELAARAGVTVSTVYHVEKGATAYRSSIDKICKGLSTSLDGLLHTTTANVQEVSHMRYRAETATWYASRDHRRAIPKDNLARLRDPAERRRLGRLGFVPAFLNNPHVVMEEGPGTMFIELHGRYETPFNARVFRDCKLYCQSGSIRARIADDLVEMGPGDIVGYRSADLRWLEPLDPLEPNDAPPLLLWVGAVRVGKAVKEGDHRTVVRKRKAPRTS